MPRKARIDAPGALHHIILIRDVRAESALAEHVLHERPVLRITAAYITGDAKINVKLYIPNSSVIMPGVGKPCHGPGRAKYRFY